jgi:hypothetical protein
MILGMARGIRFVSLFSGLFLFGLVLTCFPTDTSAAPAAGMGGGPVCPPACPPSPANCDANLVITATQDLQFGSMTAPLAGTVIVSTASARTSTGGVLLLGAGASAASFSMSTGAFACTGRSLVTVTAGPTATLTHASLPATMTVDTFLTSPVAGDAFDPAIPLFVGATLNVGTLQSPGSYSGSFLVTVTFQ